MIANRRFGLTHRALLGAVVILTAAGLTAQTSASKTPASKTPAKATSKAWKLSRTVDGQPDLQGVWTNATVTPLERPKGLGAKEFYTEEEIAAKQKAEEDRLSKAVLGRDTEKGTAEDVHYDFSQFGLDRGQNTVVWNTRTSIITGPEGTIPPQLAEAKKRAADLAAKNRGHEFDGPENRPLSARCIILGQELVPMMAAGYNNEFQITQGAGYVVIMHEMNHAVRMIPTDGRPHQPANVKQWRGDSVGHWEGDTLVVDTTNFAPGNPFRGSGERLHVVERFTRMDEKTIKYQFTVEDPTTWDKPWSGELAITQTAGPIYEFGCHEGNYALANTLRGARVGEQETAAKKSK
jgi:hypothetical protein